MTIIVDGKTRSREIKEELKGRLESQNKKLILTVVSLTDDPVTEKYLQRKQKFGEDVGVKVELIKLSPDTAEGDVIEEIERLTQDDRVSGIVVQLPLPEHLSTENILSSIPSEKDPDALGPARKVLSPVIGAIADIVSEHSVELSRKSVLVVGRGKLVGEPAELWLKNTEANITVVDEQTKNPEDYFKSADIIISGAGVPGLIKPNMIKRGTIIFDAGTSESKGKLVGDADPACAEKCKLFTPVPGGIGAMTIATLFKNLLDLKGL